MSYKTNKGFRVDLEFKVVYENVLNAVLRTNKNLMDLPDLLFRTIDYKTISSVVGALFCQNLVNECDGAMVNPIEKGHPDIIPISGKDASEAKLRNYPNGLEIKCTVGNIKQGSNLRPGFKRIEVLTGITWQAHHQEVKSLMGLVWDFCNKKDNFLYPAITGVFYTSNLNTNDWGAISGTTGRNTKVCGMKASGRKKMGNGWIVILEEYFDRYEELLGLEN